MNKCLLKSLRIITLFTEYFDNCFSHLYSIIHSNLFFYYMLASFLRSKQLIADCFLLFSLLETTLTIFSLIYLRLRFSESFISIQYL